MVYMGMCWDVDFSQRKGALSIQGYPQVVPGIHIGAHRVISRGKKVPELLADQDGIEPFTFPRALDRNMEVGRGVNQGVVPKVGLPHPVGILLP